MESYCVIQFKNKQEKMLVANLLVTNTDVEFKMTADLKTFVAEKFSVKITDYIEMKDQSTDMNQEKEIERMKTEVVDQGVDIINNTVAQPFPVVANQEKEVKKEVVVDVSDVVVSSDYVISDQPLPVNAVADVSMNQTVDVIPPTTDTLQNEQHSTQSFSIPDPVFVDQPIPDIDNSQNLVNTNQEIAEDAGDIKETEENMNAGELNGNDDVDNISVDDVTMQNQMDTPSSSITRRSGRITKRPNYSMEEDSDKEYAPFINSSKTTDPTEKKDARHKSKKPKCNKCGREVGTHYAAKMIHVTMHTDIMKFECLVNGCGYECKIRGSMLQHMKTLHGNQLNSFTKIELTPEEYAELDSMMRECFKDSEDDNGDNCQVCNQNIGGYCSNSSTKKKEHALHHVNFMLYKCMEDGCSFESKLMSTMKSHGKRAHPKKKRPKVTQIELTKEQELEIEEMLVKCFPNLDKDGNAT